MTTKHTPHHYVKEHEGKQEQIGDYMTTSILSVPGESTVKEAAEYMQSKNVGSLLVRDGDEYVGIITERDLARKVVAQGVDPAETQISTIMNQPIFSLDSSLAVEEANKFMAQKRIRHLAVTDKGKIVGILSVKDLVHFYANPRMRTW